MKKHRQLRDFVQACELNQRCKREKLMELLHRPVQHVTRYTTPSRFPFGSLTFGFQTNKQTNRYTLYLHELQKSTPVDHPDVQTIRNIMSQLAHNLSQVSDSAETKGEPAEISPTISLKVNEAQATHERWMLLFNALSELER
jgi:hypothetical protein